MRTRFKRKTILWRGCLHLLGIGYICYFGYHCINGSYGLDAKGQMRTQINQLEDELAMLEAQKLAAEKKVKLMSDGTLEADMLDERARQLLNVSRQDEIIIYYNQ